MKAVLDCIGYHDDSLCEGIACPIVPFVHFNQTVHGGQLLLQLTTDPVWHLMSTVCNVAKVSMAHSQEALTDSCVASGDFKLCERQSPQQLYAMMLIPCRSHDRHCGLPEQLKVCYISLLSKHSTCCRNAMQALLVSEAELKAGCKQVQMHMTYCTQICIKVSSLPQHSAD